MKPLAVRTEAPLSQIGPTTLQRKPTAVENVFRKYDRASRLLREFQPRAIEACRAISRSVAWYEGIVEHIPFNQTQANRDEAERRLAVLPQRSDLISYRDEFSGAVTDIADDVTTRVIVGLMLRGKRNAKIVEDDGYLDALFYTLDEESKSCRLSPQVLVSVAIDVWRTATFVPEICEFLKSLQDRRLSFQRAEALALTLLELSDNASDVLGRSIESDDISDDLDDDVSETS